MRSWIFTATLALTLALAAAPAAWATDVSLHSSTGKLYVSGDSESEAITVAYDAAAGTVSVSDTPQPLTISLGAACSAVDAHHVRCAPGAVSSVEASGGGGDDTLTSTGVLPGIASVTLEGDWGFDQLVGGPGSEVLFGGEDNDTIDGGAGDDVLWGGPGADVLRGGDGDDRVDALEIGPFGALPLPDTEIACGPGADAFRGDLGLDRQPVDCERQLAQFTGPAVVTGEARTGGTLSVGAPTVGSPEPNVEAIWWSCAVGTNNCTGHGFALTYQPRGTDVGKEIYAQLTASNELDPTFRWLTDIPIRSARTAVVSGDPDYLPPGVSRPSPRPLPPVAPPRTPLASLTELAARALGVPAVFAGHHGSITAYVRDGRRRGVLRVGSRPVRAVAVFSTPPAPVSARQVLELTPRHGKRVRRVHLATTSLRASAPTPSVVTVRLSAANRRLVHRARIARLFITLGGPSGVVVGVRLPTH